MAKFISSVASKRLYVDGTTQLVTFVDGGITTTNRGLVKALRAAKNVVEVLTDKERLAKESGQVSP